MSQMPNVETFTIDVDGNRCSFQAGKFEKGYAIFGINIPNGPTLSCADKTFKTRSDMESHVRKTIQNMCKYQKK